MFIGRTDAKAEAPILWPPDMKSRLIGKDLDAGAEIEGEKVEAETNLFSRAPELLHTVVAAMELKDVCSLEGML